MNSENSKTSDPHRLLLNLSDEIDFKKVINMLLYQILEFTIHGTIYKSQTKITNSKYQLQRGMINFNYLKDHILYQIFKIILSILKKEMIITDNHSTITFVNKIENRITFKIETGYYLELLTPKTMQYLQAIKVR